MNPRPSSACSNGPEARPNTAGNERQYSRTSDSIDSKMDTSLTVPPLRDLLLWLRWVGTVRLAGLLWLACVPFPLGAVGRYATRAGGGAYCGRRVAEDVSPPPRAGLRDEA